MNNILVIGSRSSHADEERNLSSYSTYFQSTLGESYKVAHAFLDDLIIDIAPGKFTITDTANRHQLSKYKVIVMRGKLREDQDVIFAISHYSRVHKITHLNDYSGVRTTSKLAQAVSFFLLGLPFPRTVYASPRLLSERIDSGDVVFPFIYKSCLGSHGKDNYLIKNLDEFNKLAKRGMVVQNFIQNNGDYRILIIGNKELVIKRTAQADSHLNNTSQGGQPELIDNFDSEIIRKSRELAKNQGMQWAGVDVIIGQTDNLPYFLEINSQPQIMSGAFLENKQQLLKEYFKNLG